MDTAHTIATLALLANDPAVIATLSAMGALALAGAGWAIRSRPDARQSAQVLADVTEAVEVAVRTAEATGFPGAAKYARVCDHVESWLAQNGITGDARRAVDCYLPAIIEVAVKRVDPKVSPP